MKNKKIIQTSVGVVAATAVMLSFASFAFAQTDMQTGTTGASVSSSVNTTSTVSTKKAALSARLSAKQKLNQSTLVTKSDTAIDKRIADLNDLSAKIADMKNVSDADKASLSSSITSEVSNLTDLKTKISADTDMASLQSDAKSITADNRVYDLVVPQARITSANDKAVTVMNMLTAMVPKLQQRISDAQAAGKNVDSLTAELTDLNAKLADATSLSGSIPGAISTLAPDHGSKTVAASNEAALKAGRKNLALIQADLAAARKDVTKITAGVKGVGPSANATSTVNASTTSTTSAGTTTQ